MNYADSTEAEQKGQRALLNLLNEATKIAKEAPKEASNIFEQLELCHQKI